MVKGLTRKCNFIIIIRCKHLHIEDGKPVQFGSLTESKSHIQTKFSQISLVWMTKSYWSYGYLQFGQQRVLDSSYEYECQQKLKLQMTNSCGHDVPHVIRYLSYCLLVVWGLNPHNLRACKSSSDRETVLFHVRPDVNFSYNHDIHFSGMHS